MENTISRDLATNLGQLAPALFPEIGNPRITGITGVHKMAIAERATVAMPVIFATVVTLVPAY
jgi:hypothetical protein